MENRVLVVGGAGYIGGGVTDELVKKGIPFSVYDNLTYESHYLKPVDFIYGDIRDYQKLSNILENYSHVIWLAALVGDPACAINPQLTKEINQDAVEWFANNFDGRIIFTSTCSVYGASDEPVSEDSVKNPLSAYAITKLAAEDYLKDKNSLIFRLGTAFGLSDVFSRIRMDLAVNYMTMNAIKKGALSVFGGNQWRPFIHVNDIGQIIVNNLFNEKTGVYNLATDNITIFDLASKIQKYTNCNIITEDQKFEDNRNYNAKNEKAKNAGILFDTTERTLDFGIKEIKKLIDENRVNNLDYDMYSNVKRLENIISDYENKNINK